MLTELVTRLDAYAAQQGDERRCKVPRADLVEHQAARAIEALQAVVRDCWPFLFDDDGSPRAPEELRQRIIEMRLSETST